MNLHLAKAQALAFALAILLLPVPGLAFVYSADPIEGWAVDAESGEPLQQVIVIAHWQLKGGPEGGNPIAQLQIYETLTDSAGRYYIPSWGPRFAFSGALKNEAPRLLFFKAGYKFLGIDNKWHPGRDNSKSDWHGKTVKLERFKGTAAEYAKHLGRLSDALWGVGHVWGNPCGWESFPHMLRAIDKQYVEFERSGIAHASVVSSLRANDAKLAASGCGPIDQVLKR